MSKISSKKKPSHRATKSLLQSKLKKLMMGVLTIPEDSQAEVITSPDDLSYRTHSTSKPRKNKLYIHENSSTFDSFIRKSQTTRNCFDEENILDFSDCLSLKSELSELKFEQDERYFSEIHFLKGEDKEKEMRKDREII